MFLRKTVKKMDNELVKAFGYAHEDIQFINKHTNYLAKRVAKLEKIVADMKLDQKRFTKVGPKTGNTYTTLNGRVHAIAEHLGLEFAAKPKEVKVTKAKVEAVKVKRSK